MKLLFDLNSFLPYTKKMKHILYIFLLLPFLMFSQESEVEVNSSFDGRHCYGTNGLCDLSVDTDKKEPNGTLIYNKNSQTLTLVIDRTMIASDEESKIINEIVDEEGGIKYVFITDHDFILNDDIKTSLGIVQKTYMILKGNYPIMIKKDTLTITFKLE